ncbi:MAG: pseudouridine synthase [Saprospiraceae bacterium]|nr:pseudouridine synthase [Saprospiraceae bacterium]
MPHFIVFKPYGMLSQFTPDHPGQTTLADLGFAFPKNAYPVGRLDADSEGLLLLTDDKTLNFKLLNPKSHVAKIYWAQVEGIPAAGDLEKIRRGTDIRINGQTHRTRPAAVRLLTATPDLPPREPPIRVRQTVPDSWLEITLTEGKNRQVRRMCAAIGFPVLRLVRVGLGPFRLGEGTLAGVLPGDVRQVDVGE